jgi:hypothetical protein
MWNYKKKEVCGTTRSGSYVELEEVRSVWNCRKFEVYRTRGSQCTLYGSAVGVHRVQLRQTKASAEYLELQAV